VVNALTRTEELGCESVSFPPLGASTFDVIDSAWIVLEAIEAYLISRNEIKEERKTRIKKIQIVIKETNVFDKFLEAL